ncbi:MAG: LexA family transcriptional regulator [Lewinella sp.]|uniref:LexA family transcriptional regulator n=1 Tax=Lewinella sp. TaxID=2004506 RepID=UPI003D6C6F07
MTFKKNFNEIINEKGLSAYRIWKDTGITQSTIGRYLKGETVPSRPILKQLAFYLGVSPNWLDDSQTEENQVSEPPPLKYGKDNAAHLISTTNTILAPLVHRHAQAGYLTSYENTDYMESLPKEVFSVDHNGKGNYVCFEIRGDSMDDGSSNGYRSGDIALCREVQRQHWQDKLHITQWDFVLVTRTEGIVLKRITNQDNQAGTLTLHSLNSLYEDYNIEMNEVAQLFNVIQTKRERRR